MALDFPSNPVNGQVYDNFIYNSTKGTWKSISAGVSPSILVNPTITNAVITATATTPSTIPLTVNGAASQSANLQEWKNSAGIALSRITSNGSLHTPTLGVGLLNPPDTGGEVVLQTYGRQRINSNGTNSAGIWFTGVGGSDVAFFGGTSTTGSDPIGIYHNGAWRLTVDSSGRMLVPYQPAFMAYNPQGSHLAGPAVAIFPNTRVNRGNCYNASNGRFTAPIAGTYRITFDSLFGGGSANHHAALRLNGVVQDGLEMYSTGDYRHLAKTMVYNLAAGDFVDVYVSYSGSQVWERYGSFTGELIG